MKFWKPYRESGEWWEFSTDSGLLIWVLNGIIKSMRNSLNSVSRSFFELLSIIFLILGVFLFVGTSVVWAGPFAPGETLDPGCSPGSANCTVLQITVATTTNKFGIGTTSPWAKFSVAGVASLGTDPLFTVSSSTAVATTTVFHVDYNGNIGIGATTTPGSLLSVQGIGNFTTATSTFYSSGGFNLSAGCFAINGTCVGGAGGGSGTVGSATAIGQVPYYAAASNAVTATSTLFISTASFVGIGTTTPNAALTVNGGINLVNGASRIFKIDSVPSGAGNALTVNAGETTDTEAGGALTVRGGDSYAGGGATFRAGDGDGANGGNLTIRAGNSAGVTDGGALTIDGGSGSGATGGAVTVTGGAGDSGGALTLKAGNGVGGGSNGAVAISAGTGGDGGGTVTINASNSGASDGGGVTIYAGNGSGGSNGGNVTLYGGTGDTSGNVILANVSGVARGLVGIGTSTPYAQLAVHAPAGTPSFLVGSSTGTYFMINEFGNVGIGTTTYTLGPLTMNSGAYVTTGGTWTNASSRSLKENFTELDSAEVLSKINSLDITRWNYKTESAGTTHIGPVAEEFYEAFQVGGANGRNSISSIDPAGVALLGIQALSKRLDSLNAGSKASSLSFTSILTSLKELGAEFTSGFAYFKNIITETLTTKKLCLEDVCITKSELRELLDKNNIGSQPALISGSPGSDAGDTGGDMASTTISDDILIDDSISTTTPPSTPETPEVIDQTEPEAIFELEESQPEEQVVPEIQPEPEIIPEPEPQLEPQLQASILDDLAE